MNTYEFTTTVTFMVEAEDAATAAYNVEETLNEIAFDWTTLSVENSWEVQPV